MLSCEDEAIVHINGVTRDHGSNDGPDALSTAQVPNLDVLVPAARDNQIGLLAHILGAEDAICVAWLATCSALQGHLELTGLLVVYTNLAIFTTSEEGFAIGFVISRQQLVHGIVDLVEQL